MSAPTELRYGSSPGRACGHLRRHARHEAAHAGIAHGCGVPADEILVWGDAETALTGPGPGSGPAWNLRGAELIAFYLADRYDVARDRLGSGNFRRDGEAIEAELGRHPRGKQDRLLDQARDIARRHAHSGFARQVEAQVKATSRFGDPYKIEAWLRRVDGGGCLATLVVAAAGAAGVVAALVELARAVSA